MIFLPTSAKNLIETEGTSSRSIKHTACSEVYGFGCVLIYRKFKCQKNTIIVIHYEWRVSSPEANPIENVWS